MKDALTMKDALSDILSGVSESHYRTRIQFSKFDINDPFFKSYFSSKTSKAIN